MHFSRQLKLLKRGQHSFASHFSVSSLKGRFIGPRVLVNSIPKAGTNLVQEIVTSLPLMRGWLGRTVTSNAGIEPATKKIIKLKRGQSIPSHLSYDDQLALIIDNTGIRQILVVRDPRDLVLSNINYLTRIHTHHPHSRIFSQCVSLDEKIQLCLSVALKI